MNPKRPDSQPGELTQGRAASEGSGSSGSTRSAHERADFREGGAILRPRSFAAPPPDLAEALYYEGMAAYQHRHWEEALDRFTQLKDLQPNRPGLDALLDEVRWFLQLEAAAPRWASNAEDPGHPGKAAKGHAQRSPGRYATGRAGDVAWLWLSRWRTWGLALLALIGIAALALVLLQGRLPWAESTSRSEQELYNRGQARIAAGDYEGAQTAFEKLLELAPDDPEGLLGLSRAQRQQTLAQGYAAAEAAIAEENWGLAAAELEKILAIDSSYADAQAKSDFVAQQRRLASLYDDGSRLYDLGQWEQSMEQFEKIRELDSTYRTEAVSEFLFVSYLNAGQALIQQANGATAPIQRAIEHFSLALAIHPRNRPAADARRLAILYLEAAQALAKGEPDQAQSRLELLLTEAPTYADGQAAHQLYSLLINRADAAVKAGDLASAISDYQKAQTVAVSDHTSAIEGEAYAKAVTPTPTPRPTATLQPTTVPSTSTPSAVVRAGLVNMRSGPSTIYPVIGQVGTNRPLAITARNADGSWLRVCCAAASATTTETREQGWIASALVEVRGSIGEVVVSTPPPLPDTAIATRVPPSGSALSPTAAQVICVTGQIRDVSGGKPLSDWVLVLQTSAGSTQTQRADQNGVYRFPGLSAGTYTVHEEMQAGWQAVSPQSDMITIGPSAECTVVDFWNERSGSSGSGNGAATPPR
jgi:tetratricopeptide (TPR) repeat protein/uncharacterized protein YraI